MLSHRLQAILDRLPLKPGMHVLEIGCATGIMAKAIADRIGRGFVLGIDRSGTAILRAQRLADGAGEGARLAFRCQEAEAFAAEPGEGPFDLVVAIRVGAFDGRHPAAGHQAMPRLLACMKPQAGFFIDHADGIRDIRQAWEDRLKRQT